MKDAGGGTMGHEEFSSERSMRVHLLLREMAKKYDQYDDYMQQDAHELLRHLLDSMEMEEKDVIKMVQPVPAPQPRLKHRGRIRLDGISPLPSPMASRAASPSRSLPGDVKAEQGSTSSIDGAVENGNAALAEIPEDKKLLPFVDALFNGSLASVIVCENCRAVRVRLSEVLLRRS